MSIFLEKNLYLKRKNWFLTGGKASFFVNIRSYDDFKRAFVFAAGEGLPVFVLGSGANILVNDDGFTGLVIGQEKFDKIEINKDLGEITAEAGSLLNSVISHALKNNFVGLEVFSGIPGTIGGSVYINVHYFDDFLGDFLVKAVVFEKESKTILEVSKDWFHFGYNQSQLQNGKYILISATFSLKRVSKIDVAYACGRRDEIIRQRERRYPSSRTCGSFFRNFFNSEVPEVNGKRIIYVAYYLDKVGVKGVLMEGKAFVSHKHSNMIVTQKGATTQDIINLARKMQKLVYENFGIIPKPECQLIGFDKYPLLTE